MAWAGRVRAVHGVRSADCGHWGHALSAVQAAVASVVPSDVVGEGPTARNQRTGLATAAESANAVDLAAPAAPGMVRPGRDRLSGRMEVDATYVGGEEEGVRGQQSVTQALGAIAVEAPISTPESGKLGAWPPKRLCLRP